MPIYEYECTRCGHEFEEERAISAPPRQRCPRCRGRVQKLVSQPAILFKGSGFYATDSRRGNGNGKQPAKNGGKAAGDAATGDAAPAIPATPATPAKGGEPVPLKAEKPASAPPDKKKNRAT